MVVRLARTAGKRGTKAAEAAGIRSAARAAMYKLAAANAKLGLSKHGNGITAGEDGREKRHQSG